MGNRAIITTEPYKPSNVGIYVHWNGGQESVEAFLAVAKDLDVRSPAGDTDYAMARLAQIIANFFGGTLSIGVGKVADMDSGDNGIYTIGRDWKLVQCKAKYAAKLGALSQFQKEKLHAVYDEAMAINKPIFEGGEK